MIGARWRPALRIARRTARRHPGRTVLVAALVAAPVLGATFIDTATRTSELSPEARATRELGAADAALTVTPHPSITVDGTSWNGPGDDTRTRDARTVDPARLLPPGSRLVANPPRTPVRFDSGDRVTLAGALGVDSRDPMTAGLLAVREGRLARAAGEVTLSPELAERLGTGVGGEVRPARVAPARVVGIAVDPGCRSCQLAAGLPGWTGPAPAEAASNAEYLLDLPDGVAADAALRDRLAASGILLRPRDAIVHPERWGDSAPSGSGQALAIAVLVAGIGMLEVILLAGTAFAVAARRQVRDVALVLSNGGRRSDVRRMLLAQGLVLGVLGAAVGVAAGIGVVLAAWSGLQRLLDQDFAGLVVSPRDLAVVAGVGVLSGVVAAVVPAWSASRVPVVAGLAGRFGRPARSGRWLATAGAVAAAAGLALAALVSWRWAVARAAATQAGQPPPGGLRYPLAMVAGFGLAMLGLTVLAPTLVGLAGRLAARLPLTGRLAVRDAARHRHRTGPAVGAVMVAVAGSVAVAFSVASYDRHDRDSYEAQLPTGWATVWSFGGDDEATLAAARAAAAELPATGVAAMPWLQPRAVAREHGKVWAEPADGAACRIVHGPVSAGADAAALVAGPRAAEARAALARGRAVVTDDCLLREGSVAVRVGERVQRVPGVAVGGGGWYGLPTVVLPDDTVRRLGLAPVVSHLVIATSRIPTEAEEDRARATFGRENAELIVERGYRSEYLPGFVALIGGAGLVTLAGVAISVSLSAAEGRADLATLAAVGAPPRRRRGLAMVQAALVAGLGACLGVLLGTAIGLTIMAGLDGYPLVVPWPMVLAVGLGVPALGVLVVGLATRSRLPLVRRLG